ncbi:MAG: sulfite exporter TauE/SafE family protein [Neisseria sp.]|nr:sulfite exporter TauE/SafE family protein [Neisseria sp.]
MWGWEIIAALLAVGVFAGFIAGLFGVGGGLILVPVVLWLLQVQGIDNGYAQHLAIGTSFAVMVFTSFSSARAQYKKQAVDWAVFRSMSGGVLIGVALGAIIAQYLPNTGLQIFFIVFTVIIAVRALMGIKPTPTRALPKTGGLFGAGGIIGVLSSWVGIGGGSLTVPFLTFCNVPVHRAVGTSAALGWPIAVAGTLGYIWSGWGMANLPAQAVGFVYLPAVAILAIATTIGAPLGVKTAHKLSPERLKLGFGLLLMVIALRMLFKVLAN